MSTRTDPLFWFCKAYQGWRGRCDLVMGQTHRAGERLLVDFSGQTMPVIDPATDQVGQAEIFVAVLAASNYTYAEATWTQMLGDWIGAHVRTFAFLSGYLACLFRITSLRG